jgi:ferric-dicitrate binding protein FerR (iron transport regulator)
MNTEKDFETLVTDYLSGDLSPEETVELKKQINESQENREKFLTMREIWFSSRCASDNKSLLKEEAWQRFLMRTGQTGKGMVSTGILRTIWRYAAAVAVLVTISYFTFRPGKKSMDNRLAFVSIEAAMGSQKDTCLPDGTLVRLNAASKLTVPNGFGKDERKVFLSGEGYFEVARNEIPFRVQTDELQVSVLGTKFNFRDYADDQEATVCLLEGKVLIENYVKESEIIIMEPGQKVSLDKTNGDTKVAQVNAGNSIEWTKGQLFFFFLLLPEIVKVLERSYDVKITVHPNLVNRRFYGSFSREELSITDILDILSQTGKFKYSMKGTVITINDS